MADYITVEEMEAVEGFEYDMDVEPSDEDIAEAEAEMEEVEEA